MTKLGIAPSQQRDGTLGAVASYVNDHFILVAAISDQACRALPFSSREYCA